MIAKWYLSCALALCASQALAQGRRDTASLAPASGAANNVQQDNDPPAAQTASSTSGAKWRTPGAGSRAAAEAAPSASAATPAPFRAVSASGPRQSIARVTPGSTNLPNDAGQEWRDYDISPYTARVTSTNRPEQAILDWILRETGYEVWHSEQVAVLNADHRTLHVYHTPAVHDVVSEMVDRFVNTEAESQAFGMRVITIGNPDWRTKAHRMLRPVTTQSPGVQAWLVAKEDAALLLADMRRRSDFKEQSTPHLLINNGQSKQIGNRTPRNYVRDAIARPDAWPGFEPQMGQFQEGFTIEFNPLLSLDGKVVDAVIKCEVDQVEKMLPVSIDVPTAAVPRQRTNIEVPQLISSRLHERFRWPSDQVLLISLGVVPTPVPPAPTTIKIPLFTPGTRADLLVFVESKGKAGVPATASQPAGREASAYQNRYKPIVNTPSGR